MKESLFLLSDPLVTDFGPSRPVILVSREFQEKFDVTVVSSTISNEMSALLEANKVDFIDLKVKSYSKEASLAFFELYLREASLGSINRLIDLPTGALVLNFSNTIASSCKAWYAQGPVSVVLRNIRKEMPLKYKIPMRTFDHIFTKLDKRIIKKMREISGLVVANSYYCKRCYEQLGISVDKVIYEPMDCSFFRPSTNKPTSDFALTYFGKETDYQTIKEIADCGVRIIAFGGKLREVPRAVTNHPNIETLGWISQEKLVDLYSNALFTVFPFTDEEFGYVPAESMSCGTPVLTYNIQGPAEVVLDGSTGWLCETSVGLKETAVQLWENPAKALELRGFCRKRALEFDTSVVSSIWLHYLLRA
jgi:glycosyltransferase involved in cell wall biosynthesis